MPKAETPAAGAAAPLLDQQTQNAAASAGTGGTPIAAEADVADIPAKQPVADVPAQHPMGSFATGLVSVLKGGNYPLAGAVWEKVKADAEAIDRYFAGSVIEGEAATLEPFSIDDSDFAKLVDEKIAAARVDIENGVKSTFEAGGKSIEDALAAQASAFGAKLAEALTAQAAAFDAKLAALPKAAASAV